MNNIDLYKLNRQNVGIFYVRFHYLFMFISLTLNMFTFDLNSLQGCVNRLHSD